MPVKAPVRTMTNKDLTPIKCICLRSCTNRNGGRTIQRIVCPRNSVIRPISRSTDNAIAPQWASITAIIKRPPPKDPNRVEAGRTATPIETS